MFEEAKIAPNELILIFLQATHRDHIPEKENGEQPTDYIVVFQQVQRRNRTV